MDRLPDQSAGLLEMARGDALIAERIAGDPDLPDRGLGFHAQQAVEKAIKGVLDWHSVKYPYTHDIEGLLDLVSDSRLPLPPDAQDLPRLTPYAGTLRYDPRMPLPSSARLDRNWAIAIVRRTIQWAEGVLNEKNQGRTP